MKADIAKAWADELRSGGWKQGRAALRRTDGAGGARGNYCCLGVLCELAVRAGVIPAPVLEADSCHYVYGVGADTDGGVLPRAVQRWAGMRTTEGAYRNGTLISDNGGGDTFPRIADIITANAGEL